MKRKTKIKNPILLIMGSLLITTLNAQEYRKAEEAEGLTTGSEAPLFVAADAQNKTFKLENALKEGPVVLIFYRGFWCPVCNKHLATMVVAITTVHWGNGFNAGDNGFEIPLYYMLMLFVFLANGAGKISVDHLLTKKMKLSS
ncbi:MAG: redoxin domain-containing protein [Bacteroidales bacterium]|nr:redoxin domain-containing protein [Bacteroidales bacterium]MCF8345446.1 redoxin domain-containing protein [Bacteroidales bacterium]MCF8350152.1 redoxin domain-containing protein [Bacteroidales bacterium]